jgi:hypothetical protein
MSRASYVDPFEQEETQRLRDLLPASLRPLIQIKPLPVSTTASVLEIQPRPPWQPTGAIRIDFRRWSGFPQPQRDLLFLREVGWLDSRTWFQLGPYQAIALVGGGSAVVELALHNPFSVLLASGVAGLAVRQIWQNLNRESIQFDADEFALKRAQFRGYDRQSAARHLMAALETVQRIDRTDPTNLMRLQRLQAIAQDRGSIGST